MKTIWFARRARIIKVGNELSDLHARLSEVTLMPFWYDQRSAAYKRFNRIMQKIKRLRDKLTQLSKER